MWGNKGLQKQRDILSDPEKKKARTDNFPVPIIDHICPDIGTEPSSLSDNVDSDRYDTNADLNKIVQFGSFLGGSFNVTINVPKGE